MAGAAPDDDLLRMTDELIAEVQEIRRQWVDIARFLGDEEPAAAAADERARPERNDEPAGDPRRLIAVDMMLAGRSRAEVEAHLRASFGDRAAASILADVYGES